MNRKRIAIACQGGGSQCAFVAGALSALFANEVQERFEIVGLSGTSGGALTAALAWAELLKRAQGDRTPLGESIIAFWRDLTAQTPLEMMIDGFCTQALRLAERGLIPTFAVSPSSPRFTLGTDAMARLINRPAFTDLRAALEKHLDFGALPGLVRPESPVLLLGAVDVVDGTFKVFTSVRGEIKVGALLASAAIPTLFSAVHVDGHAYWDGIFSSNPPITSFLQRISMGDMARPEEIWVIQINRVHHDAVPERPSDITDRRNQLAGNLSLQHELQVIEMVNMLIAEDALTDQFRQRFGFDITEPIAVRFIRMSRELEQTLDYPSKLSRQPAHIERLVADGVAQATMFLAKLGVTDDAAASEHGTAQGTVVEQTEPGLHA
jgi:NTE family protein